MTNWGEFYIGKKAVYNVEDPGRPEVGERN